MGTVMNQREFEEYFRVGTRIRDVKEGTIILDPTGRKWFVIQVRKLNRGDTIALDTRPWAHGVPIEEETNEK